MQIKDVDSSVLSIEITFVLLDGKTKSAYDIAEKWGKYRMENKYRIKCKDLVKKGLLFKHPIKRGNAYSLNFDAIIEHLNEPIINLNKKYSVWFIKNLERTINKVKKGDYSKFIDGLKVDLQSYLIKEKRALLIKRHKKSLLAILAYGYRFPKKNKKRKFRNLG